jgi:hypothetical protein
MPKLYNTGEKGKSEIGGWLSRLPRYFTKCRPESAPHSGQTAQFPEPRNCVGHYFNGEIDLGFGIKSA